MNRQGKQMSRQTNGTSYCNWVAFSKAVHNTLKEVPSETPKTDFRWEYAAKKLVALVLEPKGGIRGYHLFDKDLANDLIRAEMERRKKEKTN